MLVNLSVQVEQLNVTSVTPVMLVSSLNYQMLVNRCVQVKQLILMSVTPVVLLNSLRWLAWLI